MRGKSKGKAEKPNFDILIPKYNDEQILEILRKRDHYQPEAARLAINEAIKRGLINSEEDLFTSEFRVTPLKQSIFPLVENEELKKKISRSIARALLIAGVIPLIYGVLEIVDGNVGQGIGIALIGLLWGIFAVQTMRKVNLKIVRLFFALLVVGVVFLVKVFMTLNSLVFMDLFIVIISIGLIIYGLLYLIKLHS